MMHGVALKYFAEVAATGSLSAASERLFVAVSAISRQISKLEAQIGVPLFERMPRGMVLSDAGQVLLAHARRTLLESESVLQEIACLTGAPGVSIRIASSEGPAQGFLPAAMSSFRVRHPDARYDLHVCSAVSASRRVAEGEADVAVTFNAEQGKGTVVRHSERAPVCAVMSARHPLAGQASVTLRDLTQYPLALTSSATSTRKLLELSCLVEDVRLEPTLVSNYSGALLAFVRDTQGIMLSGYVSVVGRLGHDGLVVKPIDNPEMRSRTLQVQAMAGRLLPKTVEAFVRHLIMALAEINKAVSKDSLSPAARL